MPQLLKPESAIQKKARQRSVAYPSFTLESSLKFTGKIDTEFTSVLFTKSEDISKALDLSGGGFLMQLSTAVQYGLLEKRLNEGYKPTSLFRKIIKPVPGEEVRDAHIECIQNPPLYKKLIAEFKDKQLPSETGLANILDRNYLVKGGASLIASKVFLKNLSFTKLISEGNTLKFDSYIPFEEQSDDDIEHGNQSEPSMQIILPIGDKNNQQRTGRPLPRKQTKEIQVVLKGEDREAAVVVPADFDNDDLSRIIKVLTAYL
jgi:hypothetical protein